MTADMTSLVAPLVWTAYNDKRDGRTHYGRGVFGHWYAVSREKTGAWSVFHFIDGKRTGVYPTGGVTFPTLEAAKAAAQADYAARIIAALDPAALAAMLAEARANALREAASVVERHRDYGMVGPDGDFLGEEAEVIAHGHAMHYAMQDILALIDKEPQT